MAKNWRRGGVFAAGLAAGLVAALAIVGATRDPAGDDARGKSAVESPAGTTTLAAAPEVNCRFAPIVPAAGREDGLLPLDKDLQGRTASAVNTLILSGKESAAAGKPRDAETAFLMACRSAEQVDNDPVPLADAHYQLGRHYAQVAAAPDVARRDEMLKRAQLLYASSLAVYRKHKGPQHERTKFAQQGLDQLQQPAGGTLPALAGAPAQDSRTGDDQRAAEQTRIAGAAAQALPRPAPAAAPAAAPTPAPAVAAVAKPAAPAPAPAPATAEGERVASAPVTRSEPQPQPRHEARRSAPSFDCSKARSTNEKLICADEDLARQDRELGRLHDRARRNASDPQAFERDSDAEWQRRETNCQDRECLQRWYAQRRTELGAEAGQERPARPRPQRPPRVVEPHAAATPQPSERERGPVREAAPAEPAAEIVIDGPATASGDIQ